MRESLFLESGAWRGFVPNNDHDSMGTSLEPIQDHISPAISDKSLDKNWVFPQSSLSALPLQTSLVSLKIALYEQNRETSERWQTKRNNGLQCWQPQTAEAKGKLDNCIVCCFI